MRTTATTRSPASCRRGSTSLTMSTCGCGCNWDLTQHSRGAHFMEAIARLQPGVTAEQAARELASLSARLGRGACRHQPRLAGACRAAARRHARLLPAGALRAARRRRPAARDGVPERRQPAARARNGTRARDGRSRGARRVARAAPPADARRKPAACRAGHHRPARSALLALLKLAIAAIPARVPRLAQTTIDLRLLAFALAIVGGTAILFGLVPALVLSRTQASEALKDGTPHRHRRARPALESSAGRRGSRAGLRRPDGLGAARAQRVAHAPRSDRRRHAGVRHGDAAVVQRGVSDLAEGR